MDPSISVLLMLFSSMVLERVKIVINGMFSLMFGAARLNRLTIKLLRVRNLIILLGAGIWEEKINYGGLGISNVKLFLSTTNSYRKSSYSPSIINASRIPEKCTIKINYGFKSQWHPLKAATLKLCQILLKFTIEKIL